MPTSNHSASLTSFPLIQYPRLLKYLFTNRIKLMRWVRNGSAVRLARLGFFNIVFVIDPSAVHTALREEKHLLKGGYLKLIVPVTGDENVLVSNNIGQQIEKKKDVTEGLHRRVIKDYVFIIQETVRQHLSDGIFNKESATNITSDVLRRALFRNSIAENDFKILVADIHDAIEESLFVHHRLLPACFPILGRATYKQQKRIQRIYSKILPLLNMATKDEEKSGFFAHLLQMQKVGQYSSLDAVAGEVITFIQAGVDTTKNTLLFGLLELAQHPEITKYLREEIRSELKLQDTSALTLEKLMQLPRLNAFLMEVLRLYVPTFQLPRYAHQEFDLTWSKGQFRIPKRSFVFLDIDYSQEWSDRTFDPQRHLIHRKDSIRLDRRSLEERPYNPFGYGVNHCPGNPLAMAVLLYTFTYIVKEYDIYLVSSGKTVEHAGVRTQENLEVKFSRIEV